mgnify:FL=1
MEQSKSSYHRRLAYCKDKMATDKQNSDLWRQAVEVYSHLINCDFAHTNKRNGYLPYRKIKDEKK